MGNSDVDQDVEEVGKETNGDEAIDGLLIIEGGELFVEDREAKGTVAVGLSL